MQLYVRDVASSITRPVKELAGFKRVTLQPGETKQVDIALPPRAFELWNREVHQGLHRFGKQLQFLSMSNCFGNPGDILDNGITPAENPVEEG